MYIIITKGMKNLIMTIYIIKMFRKYWLDIYTYILLNVVCIVNIKMCEW